MEQDNNIIKKGRPKSIRIYKRLCKQCHKMFDFTDYGDRSGLFCSHKCFIDFKRENSTNYRIKAFKLLSNECSHCGEKNRKKLLVHHKNRDFLNNDVNNLEIVCIKCHSTIHKGENSRFLKFKDSQIVRGVRLILDGLRVNLKDENFIGTPERVLRSFHELFEGQGSDISKQLDDIFSASFPSEYSGIVIVDKIKVFSMCPHHLLPVEYVIDVGYISKHKMIGISKLPRVVELLSRRLVLQESLTNDIVEVLTKRLNADGVMCIVRGKHMCMRMRGIKKPDSDTVTSSVSGVFKKDLGARQEFLSLIKEK